MWSRAIIQQCHFGRSHLFLNSLQKQRFCPGQQLHLQSGKVPLEDHPKTNTE